MPLIRRIPKRGFNNKFRTEYVGINVSALEKFPDGTVVDYEFLKEKGFLKQQKDGVKILGDGQLTKKLIVKAHEFSKSAKEKIEKAGGKAEKIEPKYVGVNLSSLEKFTDGTIVDYELLKKSGFIKREKDGVKILGGGYFTKKLTVKANAFADSAKEKIVKAGGKAEVV